MTSLLKEGHKDLTYITVRCRVKIEEVEDPTILDITTDMRSLPGIVTVRQTDKVSDIISPDGKRAVQLEVSFIPKQVDKGGSSSEIMMKVLKSFKTVDGVDMVKIVEHSDNQINKRLPIIV